MTRQCDNFRILSITSLPNVPIKFESWYHSNSAEVDANAMGI